MIRRAATLGAVTAAGLMLAGCYVSSTLLLDPAQAAAPLAEGMQRTTGWNPEAIEVVRQSDGWYLLRGEDEDHRVLFTPLPGGAAGARRYAYADRQDGGYMYGTAEVREGRVYFQLPVCAQEGRTVAEAHHAKVNDSHPEITAPVCEFTTAADLSAALSEVADRSAGKDALADLPARP